MAVLEGQDNFVAYLQNTLFLIIIFSFWAWYCSYLFLNFEQKWASCYEIVLKKNVSVLKKLFLKKKKISRYCISQ